MPFWGKPRGGILRASAVSRRGRSPLGAQRACFRGDGASEVGEIEGMFRSPSAVLPSRRRKKSHARKEKTRSDLGGRRCWVQPADWADEDRTLARLRALRSDLIDPTTAVHNGRVVKRTGDGALVEFRSVVDAVRCAIEIQNSMLERNAGLPAERKIEFRFGIHLGDVVEKSDGDTAAAHYASGPELSFLEDGGFSESREGARFAPASTQRA